MPSAPASNDALFSPLQVGDITLGHRIVMAPLTRMRADAKHVLGDISVDYYGQRAQVPGTLLITEATFIAPQATGYTHAPGIWSDDQVASWKKIVDEVHAKGSFIYLQLWALGRAADPQQLKGDGDFDVVSASDIPFEGGATPRPLTEAEIQEYIGWYATAAKRFVEEAGGDGVEVHSANGYLIQQFLEKQSNVRTDRYGGSVENRTRFGLEVLEAVTSAVGQRKTGVRVSPYTTFQGMKMGRADIKETYSYYAREIKKRFPDLAYLHAVESRIAGNVMVDADESETLDFLHDIWSPKPFFVAGGFKEESAAQEVARGDNVAVVFGRYFISNPDLVQRVRHGIPFTPYNRDTFYLYGPTQSKGYIDYPNAEIPVKA
ncbi:hypothetical protein BCR35DRAFT_308758 [Leucosporidium creatinivorum]|uniref:NADH:flavin oxidoreductase/NADH oxidase N-terminal domain-containing protein n=1 Tax=Leucosporidium creatinivorum TaxID=106004 RepID=A0A1Y2DWX6_9BASI|nr:hypothetical protein BCR35DRAFT_308758 [Leucosporidium creatinivorum]